MSSDAKIGIIIAGIIVGFAALCGVISNTNRETKSTTNAKYTAPTTVKTTAKTKTKTETQKSTAVTWRCIDVTSYNKNPYDDNKCTSSTGEVRYVSDSQARALDPSYIPGTSGHWYYNSK